MLICLGGFIGSGRKRLAHKLAQKAGYFYYDMESIKPHQIGFDRRGLVRDIVIGPQTDRARMLVYRRVAASLPLLAKMHTDVVLEDSFHRKESREFLFTEAQKYFGKVVFVWIDGTEQMARQRVAHMIRAGKLHEPFAAVMKRRRMSQRHFQSFGDGVPIFPFSGEIGSVDRLYSIIEANDGIKIK